MAATSSVIASLALGVPLALMVLATTGRGGAMRRRLVERRVRNELLDQASTLDGLVADLAGLADARDGEQVLLRACADAHRLARADVAVLLGTMADGRLRTIDAVGSDSPALRVVAATDADGAATAVARALGMPVVHAIPLTAQSELVGVLVLLRGEHGGQAPSRFASADLAQVRVLAGFAARATENARLAATLDRLRDEAEVRERERARLAKQLAEIEHAERRRLAMLLHDGPQQTVTSVALLLDAGVDALAAANVPEAARVVALARDRARSSIRDLRQLSFTLEPPTLREEGLTAALLPFAEGLGEAHCIRFRLNLETAETLDIAQQMSLFQVTREAIANAIKHARPTTIAVTSHELSSGEVELVVANDGTSMSRTTAADGMSMGTDAMRERVAALGGSIEWRPADLGGTEVHVRVPRAIIERAA